MVGKALTTFDNVKDAEEKSVKVDCTITELFQLWKEVVKFIYTVLLPILVVRQLNSTHD